MENIESSRDTEVDILQEDFGELVQDRRKERRIENHIHNITGLDNCAPDADRARSGAQNL